MGTQVTMIQTSNGVERALEAMLERGKSTEAFLNRVTFNQYKQYQLERWQTNNSSQGKAWDPISSKYEKRKLKKCSGFPGAGKVVMIATGKLVAAATGASDALLKVVSNNGLKVYIDTSEIKYAPYPGIKRPFMQFSEATEQKMVDDVVAYLMTGQDPL